MIGANLAPRIIKKYNRMIAKTVEKLENAACDQFPPPDHYNMTEIVGESFDTDSDRLNREDACKANNRIEKLTSDYLRDSLRNCDDGEVALNTFMRRQQKYRMLFAKTRDVLGCEFDHRDRGSTFWYDVSEYFSDFGSSYKSGERFCASKGMRLCTFEEYCPHGKFGEPSKSFRLPWYQDAWSPFYDPKPLNQQDANQNNWLQVGFWKIESHIPQDAHLYNKQCWINPWGKPWGLNNDGMSMKKGLCCASDSWY